MRAISLWQPWATGIARQVKRIETRHWSTPHRGELAIHAAKRWDSDQRDFAEAERRAGTISFGLPFGAIVAVAELHDVQRTEMLAERISEQEERWGNYGPRRYGWLLRNIRALAEPVPCRGMQSMWTLDAEVAARVASALPAEAAA